MSQTDNVVDEQIEIDEFNARIIELVNDNPGARARLHLFVGMEGLECDHMECGVVSLGDEEEEDSTKVTLDQALRNATFHYCSGENCSRGGYHWVWGSDIYCWGSNFCMAAKHCGAIPAEGGMFAVLKVPGLSRYQKEDRNGIKGYAYQQFDPAFVCLKIPQKSFGGSNFPALLDNDFNNTWLPGYHLSYPKGFQEETMAIMLMAYRLYDDEDEDCPEFRWDLLPEEVLVRIINWLALMDAPEFIQPPKANVHELMKTARTDMKAQLDFCTGVCARGAYWGGDNREYDEPESKWICGGSNLCTVARNREYVQTGEPGFYQHYHRPGLNKYGKDGNNHSHDYSEYGWSVEVTPFECHEELEVPFVSDECCAVEGVLHCCDCPMQEQESNENNVVIGKWSEGIVLHENANPCWAAIESGVNPEDGYHLMRHKETGGIVILAKNTPLDKANDESRCCDLISSKTHWRNAQVSRLFEGGEFMGLHHCMASTCRHINDYSCWGTPEDGFTSDGNRCREAKLAGLLPEDGGFFFVTKHPGLQSYKACERNGTTSNPYTQWSVSVRHHALTKENASKLFRYLGHYELAMMCEKWEVDEEEETDGKPKLVLRKSEEEG